MDSPLIVIAAIVALGFLYVLVPVVTHTYQRYRLKRVVECPETKGLAEVDPDAAVAAFTSAFGPPLVRVKNCSVWPRKWGCQQECIQQ